MKKVGFVILLYLIPFQLAHSQTMAGFPFKKYFNAREYGGGIQNRTITQNSDGLIYVANNFGLLEFDGHEWRRYTLPNETKIRDISIGSNGFIYVASQGDFGYFSPGNSNSLEFTSLADSLDSDLRNFDETWKVFTRNDEVIYCTFDYIFIFRAGRFMRKVQLGEKVVNFFLVNNRIYINSTSTGLSYVDGNQLTPATTLTKLAGKLVTGILPLANNALWIATLNHGIYLLNGNELRSWPTALNNTLKKSSINNCLRLGNGTIAIGTENEGVFVTTLDGDISLHLNKEKGLANRTVLSLFEDKLRNLWLSHNNGITLLELNLPFNMINEFSNLPGTGYDGLLVDDFLYLGTNNGLYYKKIDDLNISYELIEGTEGQVYTIERIGNQVLMGHHKGAFLIEGSKATLLYGEQGIWTFLKPLKNPKLLLAGTYRGLIVLKQTPEGLVFDTGIKGLSESSRVMEQDENGNIWMTHGYKGVYKIQLSSSFDSLTYTYYNKEDGFPSNILINVWKINNRLVFSSTQEIYSYDQSSDSFVVDDFFMRYFDTDIGLNYMEQDVLGNIYYIAENEIGILEKQPDGSYIKHNEIFNRLKAQLNDDLQKLKVLETDKVLYAAKEGFILYSKNSAYDYTTDFNTLIRKVVVSNGSDSLLSNGVYNSETGISHEQSLSFAPLIHYSQNSIRINYGAPFILASSDLKYQYKLDGFDAEWSDFTLKTDKEYTNIREGEYIFMVRAKNIYGILSETAAFSFSVSPPWYRTTFAYFGYTLSVFTFLGIVYYFLDRRHKKEKKILSISKQEEINEKESALKSSEQEIEKLKNERLLSQVEAKNKELASSTMHLITKNSFINSIKHSISTTKKKSRNQEVKKELSKIITNINKNFEQDNVWESFSFHFDQVHGDFNSRIKEDFPNLTPQEMKLSAYLRMNLSTKEIAQLLNISVRGVEIARYRLRKRLNLERSVKLQQFILNY